MWLATIAVTVPVQDCLDAGLTQHVWGLWCFAAVDDHEFRLCERCGAMEQQWIGRARE